MRCCEESSGRPKGEKSTDFCALLSRTWKEDASEEGIVKGRRLLLVSHINLNVATASSDLQKIILLITDPPPRLAHQLAMSLTYLAVSHSLER